MKRNIQATCRLYIPSAFPVHSTMKDIRLYLRFEPGKNPQPLLTQYYGVQPRGMSHREGTYKHYLVIEYTGGKKLSLVQVTINRRLQIGRDGHFDQSEAYDLS